MYSGRSNILFLVFVFILSCLGPLSQFLGTKQPPSETLVQCLHVRSIMWVEGEILRLCVMGWGKRECGQGERMTV